MNIYVIVLLEFLLISSSILLLFKFRKTIGLAPLYLFLGSVRYLQALSGTMVSFTVLEEKIMYPGSIIIFSSLLFAVLLIYIKEGVSSARALILGIIISNLLLSALFAITHVQNLDEIKSSYAFLINDTYFITGTILLLVDFLLLVIIYQFLISKISKRYFFFTLFISLLVVLIFDAFLFNVILHYRSEDFDNLLIGNIIGKFIAAIVFSLILYVYLKFIDKEKMNTSFIVNQERDVFSIIKQEKKYLKLKAEKQQLEENLTSLLETTLDNISDGFISLDINWRYTYVNKKAAELLGRSREKLIGKHIWTEFPEGVGLSFYKAYYKALETQETVYFDDYYEPLDKWFENRIYPSPEGLSIYYTDITKQKKTEDNNQMLLSLIETSDDFIGLASLKGEPIYLNEHGKQLVGLKEDDEKLPISISDFFPEDYHDRIVNEHMPSIFETNKWSGETHFKSFKTGDLIPIEMSGFLIKDNISKKPIALGIVAKDITARKKAGEKLINSEQLFKRLTSKAPAEIYQTDIDGSCNYVNERWTEYAGISYEEAMGFGWATAIHPDDNERIAKEWQEFVLSGDNELETEFRFLHKNNKVISVSVKTVGIYGAQNNLSGYIGMAIDVTEKKQAEEKLIKSELLFRQLASNAPVGIFQTDKDGLCNYVNKEWIKYSGIPFDEAIGFGWSKALHPEDRDRVLDLRQKAISTGTEYITDFRFLDEKGKITWLSAKAVSLYNADNQLYGYMGTLIDITDRREAEEKLADSEQLFRQLASNAPVGIFQTDKDGACNYVNNEWINYAGLTFDEALGFGWRNAIHPEDKDKVFSEWDESIATKNDFKLDYRFLHKNGKITWLSAKAVSLYDSENQLYGYIGTLIDITDRKEAEEKLVDSEQLFRGLSSNAPVAIFQTDKDGVCNYVNEEWMKYSGLTFNESLGFGWSNAIHLMDRDRIINDWEQAVSSQSDLISDFRILNKQGETKWLSAKSTGLYDANNQLYGYIGTLVDVTKRKKAEEQIIESEKYLDNIINNIGDPLFVKDKDSKLLIVNDAFCSIFNVERDDVIGKDLSLNVSKEERKSFLSIDEQVISSGIENVNEETLTISGKESKIISTKKTRFIDDSGNKFLIGTIRDITERKKANEEIRKADQRLASHLSNSPLAIIEWDENLIIRRWSVQAEGIFGWEEQEAVGKHFNDLNLVYEEDYASTEVISNELMNGEVTNNKIINRNNTKTGKVIYCQWYNSALQSPDGEIETVLSLVQEVTERIETEEKMKESEEKFSKVFQSNIIGYSIVNKKGIRIDVNHALADILETTREHLIGRTLEDAKVEVLDATYYEQKQRLTEKVVKNGFLSNEIMNTTLKSGNKISLSVSVAPIDIAGEPHALIAIVDITQKNNAEAELEKYRNNLEELIKTRTDEVNSKNDELLRMNKLFVGRELRMKELKNIIKELELKNDN